MNKLEQTGVGSIGRGVYLSLADHQREEDWPLRDLLTTLQIWAERLEVEFKLNIPEAALRVDRLPVTRYGHFRYGHNGFGLRGEVAINVCYLDDRPFWEVLGTLLHELLHAWQQAHGTPGKRNYHNREFRDKAESLGLVVDRRGVTTYAAESPFKRLLRQYGVEAPSVEPPEPAPVAGSSKLKKWSCGCTNVRCAVSWLHARCLRCGQVFERQG